MHQLRLYFIAILLFASNLFGQTDKPGGSIASVATLVSEAKVIAPGQSFSIALQLSHPDQWHSYYQNSGGVEQEPSIDWKLPAGFTAGAIQWPVPEVKDGYFGKSFYLFRQSHFSRRNRSPCLSGNREKRRDYRQCEMANLQRKLYQRR
ncbi:MAG: hypothetical protein HC845_09835 [Akkermansiaceae bacterium]|nr:hypothetical protein [Akkermansiaceae bacterium]